VFSLISVALITIWAGEGGLSAEASGALHTARSGFSVVLTPLQHLGAVVNTPFNSLGNTFSNLTASPETLDELQQKNDQLTATVVRLEEYRLENERLTQLLEISDAYNLETTAAHILRPATESWNQVLTIDKGGADGLAVGMPVMSPNGLIGQIEQVAPFTSVVRLITDQNSGVAVFLQANRSEGVVTGSIDGMLYLSYIPISKNIVPGDVVITSGAGGVYPKGIVVGEITSATYAPSDVYQTIVVKPVARVLSYEEVLILIGRQSEVTLAPTVPTAQSGAADAAGAGATGEQGGSGNADGSGAAGGANDSDAAKTTDEGNAAAGTDDDSGDSSSTDTNSNSTANQ
jgi:rod shape-determining protein MreC